MYVKLIENFLQTVSAFRKRNCRRKSYNCCSTLCIKVISRESLKFLADNFHFLRFRGFCYGLFDPRFDRLKKTIKKLETSLEIKISGSKTYLPKKS